MAPVVDEKSEAQTGQPQAARLLGLPSWHEGKVCSNTIPGREPPTPFLGNITFRKDDTLRQIKVQFLFLPLRFIFFLRGGGAEGQGQRAASGPTWGSIPPP